MKVKVFAIVTAIGLLAAGAAFASSEFHPGGIWLDTSNQPVQAHGGGILVLSNIYHWDGEDRIPRNPQRGLVLCLDQSL